MPKKSKSETEDGVGDLVSPAKVKKKTKKKAKSTMDLMAGGYDAGGGGGGADGDAKPKKGKKPKKAKSMSKINVGGDKEKKTKKQKSSSKLSSKISVDSSSKADASASKASTTKEKKKKKKKKGADLFEAPPGQPPKVVEEEEQPEEEEGDQQEQPVVEDKTPVVTPLTTTVIEGHPAAALAAVIVEPEEQQPASMQSLVEPFKKPSFSGTLDDPDQLDNSQMIEELPPIGEIVASADDDDNVSDIADVIPEDIPHGGGSGTGPNGEQIIYNPDHMDICFDDRGHPGTKDWIAVIRECLIKFEGQEYSPPVYKAIKKKLKGRLFLIRTRRNERTSWREASKPEVIELFGECFNEERRRQKEGITDDDSEVDDSLQNSAEQSEESLSMRIIMRDKTKGNQTPIKTDRDAPVRAKSSEGTPMSGAPTPRHANLHPTAAASSSSSPRRTNSDDLHPMRNGIKDNKRRGTPGENSEKSAHVLQQAIHECQSCGDYISPFDDTALLERGIAAEQKLKMLRSLADGPQTERLKDELEKIDDLATRMKHASMAPLLELLEKIERHMTEYFQSLAEQASESSFRAPDGTPIHKTASSLSKQSSLENNKDPDQQKNNEDGTDVDGAARHHRSIPVNSDRASRSSPKSKSSRISKDSKEKAAMLHNNNNINISMHSQESPVSQNDDDDGSDNDDDGHKRNGYRIHNESTSSSFSGGAKNNKSNGVGPHSHTSDGSDDRSLNRDDDAGRRSQASVSDGSLDSEEGNLRSRASTDDDDDDDSEENVSYDDEEEYVDREEPLANSVSGSVSLGEPLRETYEMPLGGSYDESSRFGGVSASYENSGRSIGMVGSSDVRYEPDENDDDEEEVGDNEYVDNEVGMEDDDRRQDSYSQPDDDDEGRSTDDDSYFENADPQESSAVRETPATDVESSVSDDESYEEIEPGDPSYEPTPGGDGGEGSVSLEADGDGDGDLEGREIGDEGSQSLKDGVKANLDGSGNMAGDHVLELSARGLINDDMSSVGRSMPGIYGSDSDSGSDDEYEEYEEDVEDEDDLSEDDRSGSDVSEDSDESESNTESTPIVVAHEDTPNPKVEQFFDRLQHFFEVRRKMEERGDLMDPSDKFRNLKVKVHSDGIEGRNGYFKEAYQQHDLRDKVVRNLDDLYDAAEPAQTELTRVLRQMLADVKGMDLASLNIAPLKGRDRAYEKAKQEYSEREPGPAESWLYDVVRASVICKSYKQMADVNKWLGKNVHIVASKNRFAEPAFNGYRDLLFHVSIPYRGELAHICEVQVHHKDIKALDFQFGLPKHYEYFRSSFAGPWRSQEATLDDLTMLNKEGGIGGKVMKTLLKSKDPDQLRLIAGICREVLGEFDRALELYRRVLIMQMDTHGSDHEDVASTYLSIGLVLGAKGETDESLENLKRAIEIQESLLGSKHLKVAETRAEIGHMLIKKGDFAGALDEFRDAQKIRESKLGKEHFLVIKSLQDIGRVLRELGEYKSSEAEFRRALKIQEAVLGDVHNDVAVTQAMIGTTLCQYGDFGKAMESHRLALQIRETNLGKNHPLTAVSHTDVGEVLYQKGDYDVAEWRHKKALRIREAVLGKEDEECAVSLIHLGKVLSRKGKFDDAITEIKRAQKIREQNLGMDNTVTAGSYLELGNVYLEKKNYDDAIKEFRRAKVVRESFVGQLHADTALAYNCLGNALNLRGDHEAALVEHRKALAIYEQVLGKNHPKTATGYQCIADALLAKGDRDEALIEHRKALSVRANVLAKDHPDTAVSCARIGNLLYQKGDLVGASVAYRQALAITVGLCGEQHADSAKAHIHVGKVLAAQGDLEEAIDEVEQAVNVLGASLGKEHEQTGFAYQLLGNIYGMAESFDEAVDFHQQAITIIEKNFGKKSGKAAEARQQLMLAEHEEAVTEL